MYRRLEPKETVPTAESPDPEIVCVCSCKGEQAAEEEPQPESTALGTRLGVDFDING